MFPTFSGNSRRPRNVNLSGQNLNPFASTSWTPAASSGASKTVSNAQAERQQRQQERDRLRAAGNIQRTWRGHRARRRLRDSRRQAFDDIYSPNSGLTTSQRLSSALPLLLVIFKSSHADDIHRLLLLARDLDSTDLGCLGPDQTHPARLVRLVEILVAALEALVQTRYELPASENRLHGGQQDQTQWTDTPASRDELASTQLLISLLTRIVSKHPRSLSTVLRKYYTVLAQLCSIRTPHWDREVSELIARAVLIPLQASTDNRPSLQDEYEAFALCFLAKSELHLLEHNSALFSQNLNSDALASAIVSSYLTGQVTSTARADLLWLLAHFIDLNSTRSASSHRLTYLEALYVQLSSLATEISFRIGIKSSADLQISGRNNNVPEESLTQPLPSYVAAKVTSLVDREGISTLLTELTTNFAVGSSNQEVASASLLAGYILTLLRCFPNHGDEIRMRLFLGDISSNAGSLPTIKFLWQTMSQTRIYRQILQDPSITAGLLRNYLSKSPSARDSTVQEQEWRLILLFLELYIFILRLSDDEDFFSGIYPRILEDDKPASRLRSCSLSMQDVRSLTIFLKNLAFTLHYSATDILQSLSGAESVSMSRLDGYFGNGASSRIFKEPGQSTTSAQLSTADTRLDLTSLRDIVTTAMRMLYERDSRRPFLPSDHWLMTSKFDMEGFVTAVVAEQERQQELAETADDDDVDADVDEFEVEEGILHTMAGQRLSRTAQIEKMRANQRRAQRDRLLAVIGPKLEILRHMPFVIPFDTRVQIFRQFVHLDKHKRREGMDADQWRMTMINNPFRPPGRDGPGRHHGKIRRGEVFNDAFEQFYELGEGLKEPIQIQFVDQFDTIEAGIDGGGVTKEFLTSVTSEAFGQVDGLKLFVENDKGVLYPNPTAIDERRELMRQLGIKEGSLEWQEAIQDLLRRFEFLGRIVGKCMYEGILVDIAFAGFFLLKWASWQAGENSYRGNVNDLMDLDEELYQGMLRLKNYPGDVADLTLDFTITDQVSLPGEPVRTISRNLIPNGEDTYVTNDNRLLYINYVARHRLVAQPAQQTAAFLRGLRAIIAPSWLSMFNQNELQRLVGGDSSEIDVEDLRSNTVYSGIYQIGDDGREHPTVALFWKVMATFSDHERRDVLKYVTSTPRAPLLGFSQLSPRFSIRDAGHDQERLPSTSTCVNLLKLPEYTDEETLRQKLLYAVTSGAGFDLS